MERGKQKNKTSVRLGKHKTNVGTFGKMERDKHKTKTSVRLGRNKSKMVH